MREHVLRGRLAGAHQHRRPVHGVLAQDVLADEVVVGRPEPVETLPVAPVADRGAVVHEGVEPDVGHVRRVPRQRDPPRDRRAADREVAQALLDDPEDLAALARGLDRLRVLGVVREQAVLEAGELEEVVLLGDPLDRRAVDRAVPVDQVVLGVVELAGDAVEALVGARARCRRRRRRAGGTRPRPRSGGARWCG